MLVHFFLLHCWLSDEDFRVPISCVYNSIFFVFPGVVASAGAFDVDSALEFDLDHITGPTSDLTSAGSDLGDQTLPDSLLSPGDGMVSMDTGMISD